MNTLFPGRDGYIGPMHGYFFAVHHEVLLEHSHDIRERIAYIKNCKPKHEVATRLSNLMLLPDEVVKAYDEAKAPAWEAFYEAIASAEKAYYGTKAWKVYYEATASAEKAYNEAIALARKAYDEAMAPARKAVLAYVRTHNPSCAWDESIGGLRFVSSN